MSCSSERFTRGSYPLGWGVVGRASTCTAGTCATERLAEGASAHMLAGSSPSKACPGPCSESDPHNYCWQARRVASRGVGQVDEGCRLEGKRMG